MAKLYFRYGAMGSSKTANALMVRYNYIEKGQSVLMLKPKKENRDGETIIRSRIGIEAECQFIEDFLEKVRPLLCSKILNIQMEENYKNEMQSVETLSAIIIDEAQFMTNEQVDLCSQIVDWLKIPVICYGLRTDFKSNLFEGSKRLMEIADVIEEIPTVCWCGKKAHFNARVHNGKIVRQGEQEMLGGNESYISLCRQHFMLGDLGPNKD